MIAALYVDDSGPYVSMPGVDPWPKSRDAKLYRGPRPVIAHPDCGPWSKLRHMCTRQDPTCGPRAVEQVRAHGGVLEHPAHSLLFDEMGLPTTDGATDEYGGRTYYVEQVWWGHRCVKPTWLYVVRRDHARLMARIRTARRRGGTATHCVCTGPGQLRRLPVATKKVKRLTPPAFARWLVSLAEEPNR